MTWQILASIIRSPSKRVVAGSSPAGVAIENSNLITDLRPNERAHIDATEREQTRTSFGSRHARDTAVAAAFLGAINLAPFSAFGDDPLTFDTGVQVCQDQVQRYEANFVAHIDRDGTGKHVTTEGTRQPTAAFSWCLGYLGYPVEQLYPGKQKGHRRHSP